MEFHFRIATFLARLLDNQFRIFKWRFGIDPILGFFPGFGDILPLLISFYLIWIAGKIGVPKSEINKMIRYALADMALGFVPVIGDLADFAFKAHEKNLEILQKHKYKAD